jgi:hypothetical protein
MLFDLRGRRKRVIQVAYAILAVLMAASLFTVVGPFNLGDLFGGGSTDNVAEPLEDRAAELEQQLRRDPDNEALLLRIIRTRYSAGTARIEVDASGVQTITPEARENYERVADAWDSYLRLKPEPPNAAAAEIAARSLFTLAQSASDATEAQSELEGAAAAQRIAVAARPSLNGYYQLALLEYFSLDFEAGDAAAAQAEAKAPEAAREQLSTQLVDLRKQAKQFEKQQQQLAKAQGDQGEQALENPIGGLAGGGTSPTAP